MIVGIWLAGTTQRTQGTKCTASQQLVLYESDSDFNTTLYESSSYYYSENASCADGSQYGFYFGESDSVNEDGAADYIIWLGDSELCSGNQCDELCNGTVKGANNDDTVCDGYSNEDFFGDNALYTLTSGEISEELAQCLYSRVICTSDWWNTYPRVTPQTILCPDDNDIAKFRRVFIPSCTLDWWLGNGTGSNERHRGQRVLRNVLMELTYNYNLTLASRVIFGGTRGGAIAVMNLINRIRDDLEAIHDEFDPTDTGRERDLFAVLDSPWFFNTEGFSPDTAVPDDIYLVENLFRKQTEDWIDGAAFNADCLTRVGGTSERDLRWRCFLPYELLQDVGNEKLLFIQSRYDLIQLELLGLLNATKRDSYYDSASFASAASIYIETYGDMVRADVLDAVDLRGIAASHYFFVTACAQHGYIVPTSLHRITERVETIEDFGTITFQRDYEVWENVAIDGLTVRTAVKSFIALNGTGGISETASGVALSTPLNVLQDSCGSFLCNEKCLTKVEALSVASSLSHCVQYMVLFYGAMTLLIFHVAFGLSYHQVRRFRRTVDAYWKRVKLVESDDHEEGIKEVQQQLLNEASSTEYRRIHLMVKYLSYWAPPRSRRDKPYKILEDVSLAFAPGMVHAIMGPSGSGKSTLLDILALTRDMGSISGGHYINGVASDSPSCKFLRQWLRHNTSYVRQADVIFPRLTVREHLVHAAWMMLPQYMTAEAKLRRVWQVMRLLELRECADTICGDGGVTVEGGISGGQRRRVSVATQLLKMPAVLLLDEPTSGLDSTNALLLIKSLHVMAHEASVNVIMTIHQPRREIFEYFDRLSFLVSGRVVFSGEAREAPRHFGISPAATNVANDILDMLQTCSDEHVHNFEYAYEQGALGEAVQEEMEYETAELTPAMLKDLKEILVENSLAEGRWSWSESSSAATLAWVHLSRSILRGGFEITTTTLLSLGGGVLVGVIFVDVNTYSSRTALAYLTVATMTFIEGTFLGDRYLGEKRMYDYEADAGTFRSWIAFLLSQFMRDAVSSTLEALAFSIPVYWIGGLNPDPERFGIFLLTMALTSLVVLCQNVLIEIDRDNVRIAAMLEIGLLGLGALFNGFIVRLSDLPTYLQWIPYIMVTYWSFVATLINDLAGVQLFAGSDLTTLEKASRTGDVILRSLSYDNRDEYMCILVLMIFVMVFRGLGAADFYIRYVRKRGDRVKRRTVDDETRMRPSNIALVFDEGSRRRLLATPKNNTMGTMLEAQTPTMKRSETAAKLSTYSTPLTTRNPRTPGTGTVSLTPSPLPHVSDFNLSQNRVDHIVSEGTPKGPHSEFSEESVTRGSRLSFLQHPVVAFILDRNMALLLFLLDFFSTMYICGAEVPKLEPGVIVASVSISILYGLYFFLQLFFLIPITLDGKLDCTWYGSRDAFLGFLSVADLALTSQVFASEGSLITQIILAMVVRLTRFMRLLVYWRKVDMYHRVTALSFLELKDELVEAAAEEQAAFEEMSKPQKRISGFDDYSEADIPKHPRRPAYQTTMERVPAAVRMRDRTRLSHNLSRRISWAEIPRGSSDEPNPQFPRQFAPSSFWRAAGDGYYYNAATGQMLSVLQLAQRRAPPPPPVSRQQPSSESESVHHIDEDDL